MHAQELKIIIVTMIHGSKVSGNMFYLSQTHQIIFELHPVFLPLSRQNIFWLYIRIKSLDPLRAKKIFIGKAEDGPYLDIGYINLICHT